MYSLSCKKLDIWLKYTLSTSTYLHQQYADERDMPEPGSSVSGQTSSSAGSSPRDMPELSLSDSGSNEDGDYVPPNDSYCSGNDDTSRKDI